MANYYDKVLEDFELRESESILDEGLYDEGIYDEGLYDEGIYDEGIYDEGMLDEGRRRRKRPNRRPPPSMNKPSDFGKNINRSSSSQNRNFVTKPELSNKLKEISKAVNDLKKSSIVLTSSIRKLDDGYEKIVKGIAKKDRSQDNIMSNTTMMSLLGTLMNKPTFNPDALEIVHEQTDPNDTKRVLVPEHIAIKQGSDPIQVDLMKSMLFTMFPAMLNNSGGNDNAMTMMMPMALLASQPATGSASNSNSMNNILPIFMMMTMMKK